MTAAPSVSVSLLAGTYYREKFPTYSKQLCVIFNVFCLTQQVWRTLSVPAALTSSSKAFPTSPMKNCMFHTNRLSRFR